MGTQPSADRSKGFQLLRQYVRPKPAQEKCDFCAAPVPPIHTHFFDASARTILCACQACAILFSNPDSKYRRVPRGKRLVRGLEMPEALWEDLAIPINIAFFYHDSNSNRAKASYPSPAGAVESQLSLDRWEELAARNPILRTLEPDVEGLLANRLDLLAPGTDPQYYLLPIDEYFKLVGLIRISWRGLSGGAEMWSELGRYFATLREQALVVEAGHA
jgi:hypothetical protein